MVYYDIEGMLLTSSMQDAQRMADISKEIGLDDAIRGIGVEPTSSDDEKGSGKELFKGADGGKAKEIEAVG